MKLRLAFLLTFCASMAGQTTVAPFLNSSIQLLDNSGNLCAACQLDTFAAGSTTPLVTYSEATGTTPNSDPIILDSAGRAAVYLTSATYKFRLRGTVASGGATIWTQDNITWSTPLSTFSGITSTGNVVINPATAATGGANQSSPTLCIQGFYFNVTSLTDQWCLSNVVGTGPAPTSTFTVSHSGSGGAATFFIPGNVSVGAALSVPGTSTLGAVNATSITATSSTPISALSGSTGTNLSVNLGRAVTEINLGIPAGNGSFFTNSDLAAGDFVVRQITVGRKIYLGAGTVAPLAVTSSGLNFYTSTGTLPAGIANDSAGGVQVTNNTGQSNRLIDASGNMYVGAGKALILFGGTSGSTSITASPVAGSTSLAVPATNGTFVVDSATQTLSAKTLTAPILTGPTINTGVSQGSGFKHQRFGATNATAAAAGATSLTTYTWTSAFADANYTVTCTGTAQANTPAGPAVESITASNFAVRVTAITAAAGSFGGVDCIAIHD